MSDKTNLHSSRHVIKIHFLYWAPNNTQRTSSTLLHSSSVTVIGEIFFWNYWPAFLWGPHRTRCCCGCRAVNIYAGHYPGSVAYGGGVGVFNRLPLPRNSEILTNSNRIANWVENVYCSYSNILISLKIAEFRTPTPQNVRKKGSKILKLPVS